MLDIIELEPEDRLTHAIGSIIRNDNFAEGEARAVFSALSAPGLGGAVIPRDFARILDGCREMVKASSLPEFPRRVSFKVLDETGAAHRLRNALTHDRWIHTPGKRLDTWQSPRVESALKGPRPTARTLAEFVAGSTALNRAGWQLRALWLILPAWLGNHDELEHIVNQRTWWTSVALGSFSVPAGPGTLDVTLIPSPEPSIYSGRYPI
jgi:hypothetical protein